MEVKKLKVKERTNFNNFFLGTYGTDGFQMGLRQNFNKITCPKRKGEKKNLRSSG